MVNKVYFCIKQTNIPNHQQKLEGICLLNVFYPICCDSEKAIVCAVDDLAGVAESIMGLFSGYRENSFAIMDQACLWQQVNKAELAIYQFDLGKIMYSKVLK